MKLVAIPLAAVMVLGFMSVAHAEGAPVTLFKCAVGKKIVSVTRSGDRIMYHYGAAQADEITIIGTATSGNIFQMAQRYAGMEYQLRFTKGDFSYTVYASEGNPQVGAHAISGLIVAKGTQQISD
jgi:hypothetical protein